MRQLLEKRPLFAGAIVTAVALFGSLFIIRTSIGASLLISGTLAVLYQFLLGASLLTIFGWWREAGFTPISAWRHHKIFFVPFLAALSPLLIQWPIVDPVWSIVPAVVYFLAALAEETLFRGFLLRVLTPFGLFRSTIYCAVLFAVFHILRIFFEGTPVTVRMEIVHVTAVGFAYGAFRWRTKNIWPLILIHALYNFLLSLGRGNISFGETESIFLVLSVDGILVAFGYHLLQLERRDRASDSEKQVPTPVINAKQN